MHLAWASQPDGHQKAVLPKGDPIFHPYGRGAGTEPAQAPGRTAATTGLACPIIGARATVTSVGMRRVAPSWRAPLLAAPTALSRFLISLFLLFASVLGAEPAALGGRLWLRLCAHLLSVFHYWLAPSDRPLVRVTGAPTDVLRTSYGRPTDVLRVLRTSYGRRVPDPN